MTTKRTPINREMRRLITPAAIELFRQLRAAEDSDRWWAIHNRLHDEVGAQPWQWPCVEEPGIERNYEPRLEALALWQELEAAAG